jgi:hypothetical protein
MATNEGKGKKHTPHANVPGPARLNVERADNSGTVNADPMFLADRLAIINHMSAYAYLIDEGRWEDWFGLFSDDFSFEATTPTIGTVIIKGKKPFLALVNDRYLKGAPTSTAVRRHTMGNIHVDRDDGEGAFIHAHL